MITIFRNFLLTIQRFKLASTLNILGLGIAFAAFMVIMMQVYYDLGFDKFHPKSGRIFRVETLSRNEYITTVSFPMLEIIRALPHIENVSEYDLNMWNRDGSYVNVVRDGENLLFREHLVDINPQFADIFDLGFTNGSPDALSLPGNVIISESMARKFFGKESAVGLGITLIGQDTTYTVGAVYKDLPANTFIKNNIFRGKTPGVGDHNSQWGAYNHQVFVTLRSPEEKSGVEQILSKQIKEEAEKAGIAHVRERDFRLNPVEKIYTSSDVRYDYLPKANTTTTRILLSIAILIVIIAGINYVNFATALTPMRLRSINTRKVLGSPVGAIRAGLIIESLGTAVIAFGAALVIVYIMGSSPVANLMDIPITPEANPAAVWLSLGIAAAVGVVSGLYPAFYSTSFQPAVVLKGDRKSTRLNSSH